MRSNIFEVSITKILDGAHNLEMDKMVVIGALSIITVLLIRFVIQTTGCARLMMEELAITF